LKEQKEVELAKCQKLSSFFSYISSTSASQNDFGSHTNNNEQNVEENLETGIEEYKKGEEIIQYVNPVIQEKSTEDKTNDNIIRAIEDFVQYKDLALWPDSLNTEFVNNCLSKEASFFQNRKQDNLYIDSNKYYKDQSRQFSNKYFEKCLKNGQKLIRTWLCYSNSKGCVYCLVCKLFSVSQTSLRTTGYSNWVNLLRTLDEHKESPDHKKSMLIWLTRKENKTVIDKQFEKQIKNESEYYYNVLTRVVAIIKFLSKRELSLRGHDEKWGSPHNGNFMGLVELIAEFDPFLREHIVKCQSQQNKIPSYLSKTVYEEIIEIMGKRVLLQIVNDINEEDTKYYKILLSHC